MNIKLSAVIVAHNEEHQIKECIESLKFADEIVLIDQESTDSTAGLAKKAGASVFRHKNEPGPLLDVSKNFGIEKATGEWILLIDADERITTSLAEEILSRIKSVTEPSAFRIPRKNYVFGSRQSGGGYDYQIRLFRKGKARYTEPKLHKQMTVSGKMETLSNDMIHFSLPDIDTHLKKMLFYSKAQSLEIIGEGRRLNVINLILNPLKHFIRVYIIERRFIDGISGYIFAMNSAMLEFLKWVNVWEVKND